MTLTNTAKKMLMIGFSMQIFIILSYSLIYKALILSEQELSRHFQSKFHIQKIIKLTKKKSTPAIVKLLRQNSKPWIKFSLSNKALFKITAIETLEKSFLLRPIKSKMNLSIKLDSKKFINIVTTSPFKIMGIPLSIIGLFLFSAFSFLMINYWIIKLLNAPIQTLAKNLDYANKQQQWQPLALISDPEQNDIFDKINQLQMHNQKLLEERTQMLAAISHDLRTPLTRIKLRSEYFEMNEQYPKLQEDIAEMETMIHESLTYFQCTSQQEVIQGVDITSLLEALIDDLTLTNASIELHSKCNNFILQGRFNLLKRAFSNLLNNALHYGHTVKVSTSLKKAHYQVCIEDEGPGIKTSDLPHVFTPFYRAESSRSKTTGGTGLGLTIAKEIIHLHEGEITLSNRKNGGLQVLVTFAQEA